MGQGGAYARRLVLCVAPTRYAVANRRKYRANRTYRTCFVKVCAVASRRGQKAHIGVWRNATGAYRSHKSYRSC